MEEKHKYNKWRTHNHDNRQQLSVIDTSAILGVGGTAMIPKADVASRS